MSLCNSLHRPKLSRTNGLPCMAISLISLELLGYKTSCSIQSHQGIAFKTIMQTFVDFSLNWSYISCIRLILQLNAIIERSLLLLSFLEALITQSPARSRIYTEQVSPFDSRHDLLFCSSSVNWDSSVTIACTSPLASSDSTALLSLDSKGKGYHTNGGLGHRQQYGQGHDGQQFPPCEHCRRTNHHSDRC